MEGWRGKSIEVTLGFSSCHTSYWKLLAEAESLRDHMTSYENISRVSRPSRKTFWRQKYKTSRKISHFGAASFSQPKS